MTKEKFDEIVSISDRMIHLSDRLSGLQRTKERTENCSGSLYVMCGNGSGETHLGYISRESYLLVLDTLMRGLTEEYYLLQAQIEDL